MDLKEYDGTRPLDLRPRYSETEPSFTGPPGASSGTTRAYWALAKWLLVPATWAGSLFALILIPFSVPMAAITIAIVGELQILLFLQNRAELVIATMPVRSKAISRLLWYCSVVHLPIVYGIVQAFLRFIFALGAGDFSGIQVVLPTVVLAMGIASVLHLCRPVTSRFFFQGGHRLRDLGIVSMLLVLLVPVNYNSPGFIESSAAHLPVLSILALLLTGISYGIASRPGQLRRRHCRLAETPVKQALSPPRGDGSANVCQALWLDGFFAWTGYVAIIVVSWGLLLALQPASESIADRTGFVLLLLAVVPLYLFPQRLIRLDYRVIRGLPLRRWQQTALALSLALPVLLPISVGVVIVSLYVALPVAHILVFLLAYGGCCVFAVSFSATVLGNQGPICAGLLGLLAASIPLGIADPAPPVVATVGVFGALLWPISIVNFYWELRGNGWLYTKRFDTEPMVRENV